jgi:NitT/TauT family transport system substrate-binding protein
LKQAGGSSSLQIDAVLSGSADFATPGPIDALQAIRGGANLVIIGAHANNQLTAIINNDVLKRLGVSPSAPIGDRMKALKGLTIGTNAIGSSYYQLLRYYLKQYGLDPDKDVRLVGTAEASALMAGIQRGRFDAIAAAGGVAEQAISLGAGALWFSAGRGDFPNSEKSVVCVMITRPDVVAKQPQLVEAFRAAMQDALTDLSTNHDEMGKFMRAEYYQKMDPVVWDLAWGNATRAFPKNLIFSKEAYNFWTNVDAKGPESYKNVDYNKIVYPSAQSE